MASGSRLLCGGGLATVPSDERRVQPQQQPVRVPVLSSGTPTGPITIALAGWLAGWRECEP